MLENHKIYEDKINQHLKSFCYDSVVDVRLALAKILSKNIQKKKSYIQLKNILSITKTLAIDPRISVREYFCNEYFSSILSQSEAINKELNTENADLKKSCYDLITKEFQFDP